MSDSPSPSPSVFVVVFTKNDRRTVAGAYRCRKAAERHAAKRCTNEYGFPTPGRVETVPLLD